MSQPFTLSAAGRAIDGAISRMVHDLVTPTGAPAEERAAAFRQYRVAREGTLSIVQHLSQAQSDFKPAPGKWSIAQNVEHLLMTEDLYRTQIQNLIALARSGDGANIDLTFRDINTSVAYIPREVIPFLAAPLKVFNMFVPQAIRETMFRIPLIPAIAPTVSTPETCRPISELRQQCPSSLAATEAVLRGDLPPNLDRMTITHPILGTNNIAQIFRIIAAHEERHHTQMRSVIQNPRFPKLY
jgi:hypothetical protein